MSAEKQREIASKGGRAAHEKGTAHEWSADEARTAGRKGGKVSRGGRGSSSGVSGASLSSSSGCFEPSSPPDRSRHVPPRPIDIKVCARAVPGQVR